MRWTYTWLVEYYGENQIIRRKYVDAKTKPDALNRIRESGEMVFEIICCVRVDKW